MLLTARSVGKASGNVVALWNVSIMQHKHYDRKLKSAESKRVRSFGWSSTESLMALYGRIRNNEPQYMASISGIIISEISAPCSMFELIVQRESVS